MSGDEENTKLKFPFITAESSSPNLLYLKRSIVGVEKRKTLHFKMPC